VIDFGVDTPLEEAALYEAPFEYVKRIVYPERKGRSERRQREYWWLHARPSPRYREVLKNQARYIATPAVSRHHIFVWLDSTVLVDHQLMVFAFDDDYSFGVLQSRVHEVWAVRKGTFQGAGNDPRYTPKSTFETFPLPWPVGEEPTGDPRVQKIAEAARALDHLRNNWLKPEGASEDELRKRTLTKLYNDRPTWLQNAHERLDEAVFAAYSWPSNISDEEILMNLLALNLKRSAPQPASTRSLGASEA
jgi:type II restriction/modification system DNA methylase subunit YeeA